MLEYLIVAIFSLSLLGCVATGLPVLYALGFGFLLFFGYGLFKGHSALAMVKLAVSGVLTAKNVVLTMLLVGVITAVWRACGTIAYIVYHSTRLCSPGIMIFCTFLLCCLVSLLTGTSLGTAATIGVICMTMANSMGVPAAWSGGAILSGIYFGDRCSPMSTSALLVSDLTHTNIYKNIAVMLRTSVLPFFLACALYLAAGLLFHSAPAAGDVRAVFAASFDLRAAVLLPAAVIIVLSLCRVNVKLTIALSAAAGLLLAIFMQGMSVAGLLRLLVWGYHPENARLAALLSGGGILSMGNVVAIVCLSASFSGMFGGTGFLAGIQTGLAAFSRRITPYGGILLTAVLTSLIACNQTLALMLTYQICEEVEPDKTLMASHLENTAELIPALIPWSIACAIPLATVGAPNASIPLAVYLIALPLWNLLVNLRAARRRTASGCSAL